MQFSVDPEVFSKLKGVCFGVVVARGIDNQDKSSAIDDLLAESIEAVKIKFQGTKVKEYPGILPYREAFQELGYNPNKFACSIEALSSRIVKGGQLPSINNIVNLANAVSLKYVLPLGAHDMDLFTGDIAIRLSREGDSFLPFGMNEAESVYETVISARDELACLLKELFGCDVKTGFVDEENQAMQL